MPRLNPFNGVVTTKEPKAQKARQKKIPADGALTVAHVHPKTAEEYRRKKKVSLVRWSEVNDIFRECGPLELTHTIKDVISVLGGKATEFEAQHAISSIDQFGCLQTLMNTLRQGEGLDELQKRPLLLTGCRALWMDNFRRRLGDRGFTAMLEQSHAEYRKQLKTAQAYLSGLAPGGKPPKPEEVRLVVEYLPGISHSVTPGSAAIEFAPASKLLTDEQGVNVNRALRMPIAVNGSSPAPIEHRHFVLDRLRFEEAVLALYKGGPIQAFEAEAEKKNTELQIAARAELTAAFGVQLPFQTRYYTLEELRAQAERRRRRDKKFLTANISVSDLLENRGARLEQLVKQFPGRKALNYDECIGLITVLEDGLHPQAIEQLGGLAHRLRAILVLPMYVNEDLDQVSELVEPGALYGNLFGINREDGEEWKRVTYPIAGAFWAYDPQNPFIEGVPLPNASIITGIAIDGSDKLAVPPAGQPIELRGVLKSGEPSHHIINGEDLETFRGTANPFVSRTGQIDTSWLVGMLSQEDGFDQFNLVSCRHDLERNVSELLLQQMFRPDTEPQRRALTQKIDDYILANSDEQDDRKMFAGGRVVEIKEATDPETGEVVPGVIHIVLEIKFKRVVVGSVLEIRQTPLLLTAEKSKGRQGWSLQ